MNGRFIHLPRSRVRSGAPLFYSYEQGSGYEMARIIPAMIRLWRQPDAICPDDPRMGIWIF